jgi:hypothetical protein
MKRFAFIASRSKNEKKSRQYGVPKIIVPGHPGHLLITVRNKKEFHTTQVPGTLGHRDIIDLSTQNQQIDKKHDNNRLPQILQKTRLQVLRALLERRSLRASK